MDTGNSLIIVPEQICGQLTQLTGVPGNSRGDGGTPTHCHWEVKGLSPEALLPNSLRVCMSFPCQLLHARCSGISLPCPLSLKGSPSNSPCSYFCPTGLDSILVPSLGHSSGVGTYLQLWGRGRLGG